MRYTALLLYLMIGIGVAAGTEARTGKPSELDSEDIFRVVAWPSVIAARITFLYLHNAGGRTP